MRKLMLFSIAFAFAVGAYLWLLPSGAATVCAAVLAALFLLLLFFRSDAAKRVRILALGAAVGLLWTWGYERLRLVPLRALCGENTTLCGEVCEPPQKTRYGARVLVRVDGGRAYFYLDGDAMSLSLGDRVTARGRVTDVSGTGENLYFQAMDVSLLLFQKGDYTVEHAQRLPVRLYPAAAAAALRETIARVFPADTESFVRALLTGDRSGLTYAQRNDLSVAGVSHVIAVSGMHVSLLIGAIRLLLGRRRLSAVVLIAVMAFFAAMLGFSPSVTRAVIMNGILLLAPILRRENDSPTTLAFALLVLLAVNPWSLASASLQLSFLAVAGIFLLTPRLYERLVGRLRVNDRRAPTWYRRAARTVAVSVSTTVGASFFTTPLVAAYFGTVSVVSVLTNVLLLPLIGQIFTLSIGVALLGLIWTPLGAVPAYAVSVLIRFVLWAVERLAGLPFAALYTDSAYAVAWLAVCYLILLAAYAWRRRVALRVTAAAVLATLCAVFFFQALEGLQTRFTMLDVGQGQCLYYRDGGYRVVIDCGGSDGDEAGERLARRLLSEGSATVDVLILTHYDDDHIGGLTQLFHRVTVKTLILPNIGADSAARTETVALARAAGTQVVFADGEMLLSFAESTVRLYPPTLSLNDNHGLAARITFDDCDILITGDMDTLGEERLLRDYDITRAEVLVAGHHGSGYSTGEALLAQTAPQTVLISVGENNYGHPTRAVLDRIESVGAAVFRTDENGDITITR